MKLRQKFCNSVRKSSKSGSTQKMCKFRVKRNKDIYSIVSNALRLAAYSETTKFCAWTSTVHKANARAKSSHHLFNFPRQRLVLQACESLGWDHIVHQCRKWLPIKYPPAYIPFWAMLPFQEKTRSPRVPQAADSAAPELIPWIK